MKTIQEHFLAVEYIILKEGSYEVPCILASSFLRYHDAYYDWVINSVKKI